MAKRSKKKNPGALTNQQKADILFNKTLDVKKKGLDIRLNVTIGIVVALCLLAFLIMPAINMNFSSALSDILGTTMESDEENPTIGVTVNMSFLNFLTAPSGGYDNAVDYIAENTNSSISPLLIKSAFTQMMTKEDTQMLNSAYIMILIVSALWLASWLLWFCAVCVNRKNNKDGLFLLISSIVFIALSIAQWIMFLAVGIASAGKAQIQPHIASYLIIAGAIAVATVYGLYRVKIKKINKERRAVPNAAEQTGDK
ncbi:MAG: hypothetical protein K2H36_01335 [Clostridia bacterium]|nr:hypothetical protein [Clostridia bacterium]